jgi:multidrug efflux pump subunit AcrB
MISANIALLACAFTLLAGDDPGAIRVTARHPGASVQDIDSTIALPLLRQIDGVEGVTRVETESTTGGDCTITVRLDAKTDPAKILELIRKRVALAEPALPEPCRRRGIAVRTEPAQTSEFWFALSNSNEPADVRTLANYASATCTDILRSVRGVSEVRVLGTADTHLRITLDKEKLKARDVSVEEVRTALQAANNVVAINTINPSPKVDVRLIVRSSGRLSKFDEIVIKTDQKIKKVFFREVGKIEIGSMMTNELTTFDGKPAALIEVIADRNTSLKQVESAFELLRKASPPGMQFTTVVTPTTPRVLRMEVQVRDGGNMEYTQNICEKVTKVARDWNGGLPAIEFTDKLQSDRAALLVTCKPDADIAVLQKRLTDEVRETAIRIADVTGGKPAFPVRIALSGSDSDKLRHWSEAILARARKDGIVNEVTDWPDRDRHVQELIFDKDKAAELGINLADALDFLTKHGLLKVGKSTELKDIFMKNPKGELVELSAFITMKPTVVSSSIYRLDLERAMRITANPANGKSVTDCADKLRALAESEKTNLKLPTGYRTVILAP